MARHKNRPHRGPTGKPQYDLDYIEDRDLYAAVMFARLMIRNGSQKPPDAITIAANHYQVPRQDVNYYVSQAAGRIRGREGRRAKS